MWMSTLFLLACARENPAPTDHAPPLDQLPEQAPLPERSVWLVEHQAAPVPAQGPAPAAWSELEARTGPEACGTCHVQQYQDWLGSWHAMGMGPGLIGQLEDWDGKDDKAVLQCSRCHAPLAEQHPRIVVGERDGKPVYGDNPDYLPEMRGRGLTCTGCHVRGNVRYGPPNPRSDGSTGAHGGFVQREEFLSPAFCTTCHDFTRRQLALEGKLIQETGVEWSRTRYAADGVGCRDCHMPDKRHLWRGIHDPAMVRSGITVESSLTDAGSWLAPIRAVLTLTNSGVGHRLPTYVTPEITLIVEQWDAAGLGIPGTRRDGTVARRVTPNLEKELFDTRLLPGESYTLTYAARRDWDAVALTARVEVWPDEGYRRFYAIKLKKPDDYPKGLELMKTAHRHSIDSRYTVWDQQFDLP